jgi:hypothetical protein
MLVLQDKVTQAVQVQATTLMVAVAVVEQELLEVMDHLTALVVMAYQVL